MQWPLAFHIPMTLLLIVLIINKLTTITEYNETVSLLLMNFRNCISDVLPMFSVMVIFVVVLALFYAELGIGTDSVDDDYPSVDVVTSTFFFVVENTLGTPKKPPMAFKNKSNGAVETAVKYALLFLWMAH